MSASPAQKRAKARWYADNHERCRARANALRNQERRDALANELAHVHPVIADIIRYEQEKSA